MKEKRQLQQSVRLIPLFLNLTVVFFFCDKYARSWMDIYAMYKQSLFIFYMI